MSTVSTELTSLVSTTELRDAYRAAARGDFRAKRQRPGQAWSPPGLVIVAVGCQGQVGTTTVALALGQVLSGRAPTRVLECAHPHASGLVTASTRELGQTTPGWKTGRRDQLTLQRVATSAASPVPPPSDSCATVLDPSRPLWTEGDDWVTHTMREHPLILVARATPPGLRRLEVALATCGQGTPTVALIAASRGARDVRGWHTPLTSKAQAAGRVVDVPHLKELVGADVGAQPLPPALLAAASRLAWLAAPHLPEGDNE